MTWYYGKNGQQIGPITEQDFISKCASGEILPTDLVWKEGMPSWRAMQDLTGLSLTQKNFPPMLAPQETQSPMGSAMVSQPPALDSRMIPQRIPSYQWQSIVALVLGGVQMMVICFPVGLVCGIVALVHSNKVEPYFLQQKYLEAEDASRNAKIWMIVSISFSCLFFIGCLVLLMVVIFNSP